MQKKNHNIFDIFKSNKEKKPTQEEGEGTVEESPEDETDDIEETESEIYEKDNNSVEEVSDNNTIKEKINIELYTPYIIIMILIIIIVKLRSKLKKPK
jgi:hypothetical protein